MSVKRYEWVACDEHVCHCDVVESAEGDMVDYEDYAALEARCAALAAENSGLKSAIEKHADSYIMCGYCRTERDGKNDDVCEVLDSIPATDAFLAEVRAQGADECVRQLVISDDDDFSDAPNICAMVAHQLRKGVQS
ncbi:hypothetical protein QAA66_001335 [Enterobacter asburiae]|uniref:Uncharacterized protein n=2 Tax=Enterobacter asburiae TaxID=61645 RepID=A0ABU6KQ78_ENTAS|nr:hypothetical protein [Enterobacter asburiae]CZW93743.1 Uncharacterised protein [Enterobacter cloacae]KUQ54562.1 hypothetical protein AWI17_15135 [Enterobacter asburiae]MCK1016446.1 hypothetical protein [Enterobacter asburiae]MDU4299189.1 hypothetical protein [Enterobacter asburiae]MEC5728024.1 hypothetical protein [Enterobacter asburiae]